MKLQLKKGSTSVTLYVFIQDSASTTGNGKTGLAYNTSSLTAYYVRPLGSATSITLATQTVTGAWSSGGFVEVDSTNMPGWYRFDIPDACLATGVNSVGVHFRGAAGMAVLPMEVQLVAYDPQDSVRLGLTAIPNAAASAVGGLPVAVDTSGRVDVLKVNGTSQTARDLGASVLLSSGTGTGQVSLSSGAVTVSTNNDKTGYGISAAAVQAIWDALTSALTTVGSVGKRIVDDLDATISSRSTYAGADTSGTTTLLSRIGSALTISGGKVAASLASTDVTGNVAADVQTIKAQAVTCGAGVTVLASVGTAATSTAQTGDSYGRLGSPAGASVSADVAAVKSDSAAIKAKTDNLPASPAAAGDAMTLTSGERTTLAGVIWAALTSGLTTVGSVGKRIADNLDAAISSRSTYAGSDTSGTTTLIGRLTSTRAGNLDNLDAAVSTRSTHSASDVWAVGARTLTSFGTLVSDAAEAVWAVGTRTLTAFGFSVSATVSDKTGYSLTSDYDPAKTAAQAGDAMALTSAYDSAKTTAQPADIPTAAQVADKVLGRNLSGGSDGGRTVQDALRILRNKVVISGGTITVYAEDDTTIAFTGTVTTDAAANPITAVDPE